VVQLAGVTATVLGDGEEAARLEGPADLGEEPRTVRDVHRDVLGVRAVEGCIVVRQVLDITLVNPHPVLEAEQGREPSRSIDERLGEVDARHGAAETLRHVAGRPTQAATEVYDVVARFHRELVRQLDGGREPTRMEVVDRCHVLQRERVQRLPALLQRGDDHVVHACDIPVISDRCVSRHNRLLVELPGVARHSW
jgi:hypothetical protein